MFFTHAHYISWNIKTLVFQLRMTCTLFASTYIDKNVQLCQEYLREAFKSLGESAPAFNEDEDESYENVQSFEEETAAEKPFKTYILKEIGKYHTCHDKEKEKNPFYIPQWFTFVSNKWLANTPFWSSILRGMITTNFILVMFT